MEGKNKVFIATSMDGYIADKDGGIAWLDAIPNPDNLDMGYVKFMKGIDALLMGRTTFETVCGFDIDWPYEKPVYVLSNTLNAIPEKYDGKAFLVSGDLDTVLSEIHAQGHRNLYIDGGKTIQSFLSKDLIDELIISLIPVILGDGIPLFGKLENALDFKCVHSEMFLDSIVQNHFIRKR